jgi:hypothetical protein
MEDTDLWGEDCENSRAITQASAEFLGIPGFDAAVPNDLDYELASAMLGEMARGPRSSMPLYSGHSLVPSRFAEFIPGRTVRLPLTAATVDEYEAAQYTIGWGDMNGGKGTVFIFEEGSPYLNYGAIEDDEKVVAGDFEVVSVTEKYQEMSFGEERVVHCVRLRSASPET